MRSLIAFSTLYSGPNARFGFNTPRQGATAAKKVSDFDWARRWCIVVLQAHRAFARHPNARFGLSLTRAACQRIVR
jgi:hypothetical protein